MQAGKNITAKRIHTTQSEKYKYPCFGGNGLRGYVTNYNTEGTFSLVGRQGALCGNVNIVSGKFYATEHAVVTDGYGLTDTIWVYFFLQALNLNQYATATAQPGLAVSNIIEVFIPLPPIAEQYRIVEKIQKLLPIIKQYSNAQIKLNILNKNIKIMMRKSVLQEAIQGKLVPQDPNDEPASVLLQRIKEEKLRLIKEGKLKKKDIVDSIIYKSDDNKYYPKLPKGWVMCKLSDVCKINSGFAFSSNDYCTEGIPLVRISNIKNNTIDLSECVFIQNTIDNKFLISKGDLLIAMSGATTGKIGIYDKNSIAYLNQRVGNVKILSNTLLLPEYRNIYMLSKVNEILNIAYGGAQPNISTSDIENLDFMLPPLSEQKRIVTKVEDLLGAINTIVGSL